MNDFLIQEQIISKKFNEGLQALINDHTIDKSSTIVYLLPYDKIDNIWVDLAEVQIPLHKKFLHQKLLQILEKMFKSKIINPNTNLPESNIINFFEASQEILSYIEILCDDSEDNLITTNDSLIENNHNLAFLNNGKYYPITLDLMLENNKNELVSDLNVYYLDNQILKFKFKAENLSLNEKNNLNNVNDINSQMIIDDDMDSNLQSNKKISNLLSNFYYNTRAFIGCLNCQILYLLENTKENCGQYILNGNNEGYFGTCQRIKTPVISILMNTINVENIMLTFSNMNRGVYENKICFQNDMEITTWIKFMSDIQPFLNKLQSLKSINNQFSKILFLIHKSTKFPLIQEENSKEENDQNLLNLIKECFDILKPEVNFTKNYQDWVLFNFIKIFHCNKSVNFFVIEEINNLIIKLLKEKLTIFTTNIKINELNESCDIRAIKGKEFSDFKATVEHDIKRIKNSINFLVHINWGDKNIKDVEQLIITLKEKNMIFIKLYKMLDEI